MLEKTKREIKYGQSETLATLDTQDTGQTQFKKTKYRKLKKLVAQTPQKTRRWTQTPMKSKQFLFLIRHLSCYSYSHRTPLSVIKETTQIRHDPAYKQLGGDDAK